MSKPPIGLKPKKYHSLERLNEVRSAIVRYYDDELPIPVEWIEEYNELINQNKDEKDPNAIYDWGSFPLEKNFNWNNHKDKPKQR